MRLCRWAVVFLLGGVATVGCGRPSEGGAAGREVRVMVQNEKVDDAQALVLSKDIARAIEAEASYPGQVRVVVVRETRASDYAR